MTYPMLGDGANDFSRSKANWETLPHYFLLCTGELHGSKQLSLAPHKYAINAIWTEVFGTHDGIRKSDNPHMLPHGGTKWGNKFEPVTFRLDKKSRHRRFIPRKKEPKTK